MSDPTPPARVTASTDRLKALIDAVGAFMDDYERAEPAWEIHALLDIAGGAIGSLRHYLTVPEPEIGPSVTEEEHYRTAPAAPVAADYVPEEELPPPPTDEELGRMGVTPEDLDRLAAEADAEAGPLHPPNLNLEPSWAAPEVELQYAVEWDWKTDSMVSVTLKDEELGDTPETWTKTGTEFFLTHRNLFVLQKATRHALVRLREGICYRNVPQDLLERFPETTSDLSNKRGSKLYKLSDMALGVTLVPTDAEKALDARYRPFVLSMKTLGLVSSESARRVWETALAEGRVPPLPDGLTPEEAWRSCVSEDTKRSLVYLALDNTLKDPDLSPVFRLEGNHNGKAFTADLRLTVHALVVDEDEQRAYFPIVVSLVFGGDAAHPKTWSEEDRAALWDGFAAYLKTVRDALDRLIPPTVPASERVSPAGIDVVPPEETPAPPADAVRVTRAVVLTLSTIVPEPERMGPPAPERRYLLDGPTRFDRDALALVARTEIRLPRKWSAVRPWDELVAEEIRRLQDYHGEAAFKPPIKLLRNDYRPDGTKDVRLTREAETNLRNQIGYRGFRELRKDRDGVRREYLVKRFKARGGYMEASLAWYGAAWPLVDEGLTNEQANAEELRRQLLDGLPFEDLTPDLQDRLNGRLRQLGAIRDGKLVMSYILSTFGRDGRNPVEIAAWELRTLLECERSPDGFDRVQGCLRALQELRYHLKLSGVPGESGNAVGPFLADVTYVARGPARHTDGTFQLTVSPYFVGCLQVFQSPTAFLQTPRFLVGYDWTKDLSKEDKEKLRGRHLKGFSALAPYFDRARGFTDQQTHLRRFLERELTLQKDPCSKRLHGRDVRVSPTAKTANEPRAYGRTFCPVLPAEGGYHAALGHFRKNPEGGRKLYGTATPGTKTSGGHTAGLLQEMGYELPSGSAKSQRDQIVKTALQDLRAVVEEAFGGVVAGRFGGQWFSLDDATMEIPVEALAKDVAWFLFLANDWRDRFSQTIEDYHKERYARGETPYEVTVTTDRTLADRSDTEREALPPDTARADNVGIAGLPLRWRLHGKREHLKLKQEDVGKLFGVTKKTVMTWEKGQKPIPADVVPLAERWVREGTPPATEELAALAARRARRPGVRKTDH